MVPKVKCSASEETCSCSIKSLDLISEGMASSTSSYWIKHVFSIMTEFAMGLSVQQNILIDVVKDENQISSETSVVQGW